MHYINFVVIAALGAGLGVVALPDRRFSRRTALGCMGLLFLWAWPPVAWLTSATLERYDVSQPLDTAGCGANVVLSGSILEPNASRPEPLLGLNTYVRCAHAAWLYHRHPLPVVTSGGWMETPAGRISAAQVMRDYL